MGILTDFFVATREEVENFDFTEMPRERFPTLQTKGLDPVKMATLHTILVGADLDDVESVVARIPEPIHEEEDGELVVFALPEAIVHGLADLDDNEASRLAERWVATEEFKMEGWTRADIDPVLSELRTFMEEAVRSEKDVFLWVCV
ncbi:MAG: hypothetical protein Q8P41_27045 [Pseudomonadota bacterium]|nr:hypothetical protein [Pseudomonadota bacterium]